MSDLSWQKRAKCLGIENPDIFHPPRDKNLYKTVADQAKAVCLGKDGRPPCPVLTECAMLADQWDDQYGIFGGMSPRERNAFKRKAARNDKTLEEWLRQSHGSKKRPPKNTTPVHG
jgi:hypothetical protein